MAFLWEVHHTSSESHTPHSHPFFKCFPAFHSQHLTHSLLLYQFSQTLSMMHHPHFCYCFFSPDFQENEWNRTVLVCFQWGLGFGNLRQRLLRSIKQRGQWVLKILDTVSETFRSSLESPAQSPESSLWSGSGTVSTRWIHRAYHMVTLQYVAVPSLWPEEKKHTLSLFDFSIPA